MSREHRTHLPVWTDPTGGDPFMGGPVRIMVCAVCHAELSPAISAREEPVPLHAVEKLPEPTYPFRSSEGQRSRDLNPLHVEWLRRTVLCLSSVGLAAGVLSTVSGLRYLPALVIVFIALLAWVNAGARRR